MNRKKRFILKTICLNTFIIYSAYIFLEFLSYEVLMGRQAEILFVVLGMIVIGFRCWGMLSNLVRLDYPKIKNDKLISIAENVELFLAIGIVSLIFIGVYFPSLSLLWEIIFIVSYSLYLIFHVFYIVHRRKFINN